MDLTADEVWETCWSALGDILSAIEWMLRWLWVGLVFAGCILMGTSLTPWLSALDLYFDKEPYKRRWPTLVEGWSVAATGMRLSLAVYAVAKLAVWLEEK